MPAALALPMTAVSAPPVASFHADPLRYLEHAIGTHVPVHPHVLSAGKLVLAGPITYFLIEGKRSDPWRATLITLLFAGFLALDYLDGVVARERKLETPVGRVIDRVTDFPVLLVLGALTANQVPALPLSLKLGLDLLLLVLYSRGLGSTHNRLRTTVSYVSLFALLMLSQGWASHLITAELTTVLLWINAAISLSIVLRRLGVLRSRRIADGLSLANLGCGVLSMSFAARGQLGVSLVMLTLGAALDGMDGAAARRWGGSRYGVYMDDIADAVSYGIAPGFAIYATLHGLEGALVGGLFVCFVIARLVFFTLNKAASDPSYFRGVPSTAGGLVTLCSLFLFSHSPLLVGFFVGIGCALMVAFDVQHRHLGRALASRGVRAFALALLGILALSAALGGQRAGVCVVLAVTLLYGFLPSFVSFYELLRPAVRKRATLRSDEAHSAVSAESLGLAGVYCTGQGTSQPCSAAACRVR